MAKEIVYTFEFIGSELEVADSRHQGYLGMEGKVIDETKKTFVISVDGKEKTIPKKGTRFKLTIDGRKKDLDGNRLTFRPENRIKKLG